MYSAAALQHQPFQFILRLLNTNIDGKRKIMYALTEIRGVGRRYANVVCKKADVDLGKRLVDSVGQAGRRSERASDRANQAICKRWTRSARRPAGRRKEQKLMYESALQRRRAQPR